MVSGSMGASEKTSLPMRCIERLIDLVMAAPKAVVICAVVLSALSAWYALDKLQLDANTDSLISPDRPFMVDYREFIREFGDLEYLYVAVDARGHPAAAKVAVDELLRELATVHALPKVSGRIDGNEQWRIAPRAMPTENLRSLLSASDGFAALMTAAPPNSAAQVLSAADEQLRTLMSDGLTMKQEERERIGASAAFLLRAVSAQPNDDFAFAHPRPSEYLVSASGQMFFIEILPRKDFSGLATIEPILKQIRSVIANVQSRSPAVEIGLTGKPVLQADELSTTNDDMTRGTLIAATLVTLMTMWSFASIARPILAMIMLALTFACTYGAAALLVGRLNLLSLVFMLVLVSAGVDYGIHTIARYTEFRRQMGTVAAVRAAMTVNTIPTWVGALTSAIVFFIALATEFGGLRELGIIAGTGLILCALMMTIVLPAMIVIVDGWRERRALAAPAASDAMPERSSAMTRFSMADPQSADAQVHDPLTHSRRVIVTCVIITIALCSLIPTLRFESNLLRLQASGLDSIKWEHRILEDSVSSSWFGAVICRSEDEIAKITALAHAHPLVQKTHSVLDIVVRDSPERVEMRSQLASALESATSAPRPNWNHALDSKGHDSEGPLTAQLVKPVLSRLNNMIALAALQAEADELAPLRQIAKALGELERNLDNPQQCVLAQETAEKNVANTANALRQMGISARATLRESLPIALRDRFVSPEGGLLVSIFPRYDLWEFQPLQAFVGALRDIAPRATGAPMTVYESVVDMRSAFIMMSTWSLLAIAILVWLDLRSIVATLACLVVLLIGISWTFGLMGMLGISLNLANFFGVPMLLGFGMDSSIHVIHRAREQGNAHTFGWTTRAVTLSAVTTATGFGTLLFAEHRGLQSLGGLMFIGSVCSLLCAVILLPAALRCFPGLLGRNWRNEPPREPVG